jgi:hypothetical protein
MLRHGPHFFAPCRNFDPQEPPSNKTLLFQPLAGRFVVAFYVTPLFSGALSLQIKFFSLTAAVLGV